MVVWYYRRDSSALLKDSKGPEKRGSVTPQAPSDELKSGCTTRLSRPKFVVSCRHAVAMLTFSQLTPFTPMIILSSTSVALAKLTCSALLGHSSRRQSLDFWQLDAGR